MLVNYRFKNFKSFYEENELSLQCTNYNELSEINTFKVDRNLFDVNESNELLKSVVIFGGNASGKSNIIKAITYMYNVVQLSAAQIPVVKSNEFFAFYDTACDEESLYEVEIISHSKRYIYGFTILHGKINQEWLYKRVERKSLVFSRKDNKIKITGGKSDFININDDTLFLSVGKNFNLNITEDLLNVREWFNSILIAVTNNANSFDIYSVENEKYKNQALEIMQKADIGLKDFKVVKDKLFDKRNADETLRFNTQFQASPEAYGQLKEEGQVVYNIDIDTKFNIYNKDGNKVGTKDVMLLKDRTFNSEGTLRLFCYLGFILAALDKGRVVFIDEIDSKLHFLVADYLIEMFNSINVNWKNAQLICTAHSVMLMDDNIRRDQIYFTSKDEIGKSSLVSLADFKNVRAQDLFSKKYLAGFYSKLPDMNRKV